MFKFKLSLYSKGKEINLKFGTIKKENMNLRSISVKFRDRYPTSRDMTKK